MLPFSTIKKCSVVNKNGTFIGVIKNCVIGLADREIHQVTLCTSGFLGMETKYFILPFSRLYFDDKIEKFVLTMSNAELEARSKIHHLGQLQYFSLN